MVPYAKNNRILADISKHSDFETTLRSRAGEDLIDSKLLSLLLSFMCMQTNRTVTVDTFKILINSGRGNVHVAKAIVSHSSFFEFLVKTASLKVHHQEDDSEVPLQAWALYLLATLTRNKPPVLEKVEGEEALSPQVLLELIKAHLCRPRQGIGLAVPVAASFLLAQLVRYGTNIPATTCEACLETETLLAFERLFKQSSSFHMSEIEGTGFGFPITGSADGVCRLLHGVVVKLERDNTVINSLVESGIWTLFKKKIESLHFTNDLSFSGLTAVLHVVLQALCKRGSGEAAHGSRGGTPRTGSRRTSSDAVGQVGVALLSDELLVGLVSLCRDTRLKDLASWPAQYGGGSAVVGALVKQVVSILYVPFTQDIESQLLARVQKMIYNQMVVRHLVATTGVIRMMRKQDLEMPVVFLCRLVLGSNYFVRQFVDYDGMTCVAVCDLLNPDNTIALLVDTLQLISQLARVSKANYPVIHQANLYHNFAALLSHQDVRVRSKCANLMGNLCRHSAFFYPHFVTHSILRPLIRCCGDADSSNSRKFACFAVGNAGFHNDTLCKQLSESIPFLVAALQDSSEKTRANAAGALGNLVRNSDVVIEEIVAANAIEELLKLVLADISKPAVEGVSPARIALFSLGNLASFSSCSPLMRRLDVVAVLQNLIPSCDSKCAQYIERILAKLKKNAGSNSNSRNSSRTVSPR